MVTQHYRWDFIGLSTDTKPTSPENEKVTNGSTYYEADTSKLFVYYKDQWYEKKAICDITDYLPTDTASGNIAYITDGEEGLPLESLIVTIEPEQAGTGIPSIDNIREITGFTSTSIIHAGKNLLDTSRVELGTFNQTTGEPTAGSGNQQRMTYYIKVNPGDKIVQTNSKSENNRAFFYNGSTYVSTSALANGTAVTVPNGVDRVKISSSASGWTGASAPTWAQVEFDSASDYEPYDTDTYNISWQSEAGTIYGGSLNVTTGVLTVDMQRFVMDGTTRKLTYTSTSGGYRLFVGLAPTPSIIGAGTSNKPYLSNIFNMKYTAASGQAYMSGNNGQQITMYLPDQTIDNLDDANAWLEQNQPEFVVALATPVTYQLTPIQIDMLLGINNIWNNTGNTSATYKASIQGYIDKKVGTTNLAKSAPKNLLSLPEESDDKEKIIKETKETKETKA